MNFSLSDFLAQQKIFEAAPMLQESTYETESLGEVEIKPSVVHLFLNPLFSTPQTESSSIQTSVSTSLPFVPQQVMAHPTPTRMQHIFTTRYAPLLLSQPFYPLPQGDYLKYFPKYTREGEGVFVEEHLVAFYSYADNQNIKHEDVWSKFFVQSLDREARKCFRNFPPNSITRINDLEQVFIKKWGDWKYYLYYLTDFGALKKKNNESLEDFTKRFIKVCQKIPVEVKPLKTTTTITFANALDSKFALWLRAEKLKILVGMKEAAIGVHSNLMASNKLKIEGKAAKYKKKMKEEKQSSSSKNFTTEENLDQMSNLIKDIASKMTKLELENRPTARPIQNEGNRIRLLLGDLFSPKFFYNAQGEILMIKIFNL